MANFFPGIDVVSKACNIVVTKHMIYLPQKN